MVGTTTTPLVKVGLTTPIKGDAVRFAGIRTTEASTLGWKPGCWPEAVRFAGMILPRLSLSSHGALYGDRDRGIQLDVWND